MAKKESLINAALKTARDCDFDTVTMRKLETLAIIEVEKLSPQQIKNIRLKEKLSQNIMAIYLNISPSTYQKWERGEVTPHGGNLKLLNILYRKGLKGIVL
ncbi:MAG TPA: helix-turn-helix domain-containing protein [Ignavibacteria bacterium]|nr:helix-turn-helix domain-containing protein [Ignavibacteria bacterium]